MPGSTIYVYKNVAFRNSSQKRRGTARHLLPLGSWNLCILTCCLLQQAATCVQHNLDLTRTILALRDEDTVLALCPWGPQPKFSILHSSNLRKYILPLQGLDWHFGGKQLRLISSLECAGHYLSLLSVCCSHSARIWEVENKSNVSALV